MEIDQALKAELGGEASTDNPLEIALILTSLVVSLAPGLSVLSSALSAANSLRTHYSIENLQARMTRLFTAYEKEIGNVAARVAVLENNIVASIREAFISAIEETSRTPSLLKIDAFGRILAHAAIDGTSSTDWDEANSYIRDVGRMTEADLKVLASSELRSSQTRELKGSSDGEARDFYWRCHRLESYGFLTQMIGAQFGSGPSAHERPSASYRLTLQGEHLSAMIAQEPSNC